MCKYELYWSTSGDHGFEQRAPGHPWDGVTSLEIPSVKSAVHTIRLEVRKEKEEGSSGGGVCSSPVLPTLM